MREIFNPNSTFISQNKIKSFDEFLEDISKQKNMSQFNKIKMIFNKFFLSEKEKIMGL